MGLIKNIKNIFTPSASSVSSAPSVGFSFTSKKEYVNSKGVIVPAELVSEKNKAKQALCDDIVSRAKHLSTELLNLKLYIQKNLRKYKQWDATNFGVKIGEAGNISVIGYDGKSRIQVRSHPTTIYSPQSLEIAQQLMGEIIDENTTTMAAPIRKLIQDAFSTDSQLSLVSITELMKVEIDDIRWKNAIKALNEGRDVVDRAYYVDVAEKDKQNKFQSIPLDISKVK